MNLLATGIPVNSPASCRLDYWGSRSRKFPVRAAFLLLLLVADHVGCGVYRKHHWYRRHHCLVTRPASIKCSSLTMEDAIARDGPEILLVRPY